MQDVVVYCCRGYICIRWYLRFSVMPIREYSRMCPKLVCNVALDA